MKFRKNDGFTLVELMVTIVIASIVTAAASTVLLLGIRLNSRLTDTAQQQNTARVFLSVMENMASSGEITKVVSKPDYWYIVGKSDTPETPGKILFYYKADDAGTGTIYSGGSLGVAEEGGIGSAETLTDGVPMMEGVIASHLTKDEKHSLLTVSVETADESYTSSVYCRAGVTLTSSLDEIGIQVEDPAATITGAVRDKVARGEFLKLLLSQLGSNGMYIKDGVKTPLFFSRWYSEGWPPETPWCACYISWALNQLDRQDQLNGVSPENATIRNKDRVKRRNPDDPDAEYIWYADVDDFVEFFEEETKQNQAILSDGDNSNDGTITKYSWVSLKNLDLSKEENKLKRPHPGDILFMDWSLKQEDAAHVGVVLAVKGDYVYTIEGNSANTVAVRKYSLTSPVLMGYGTIDWKPDPEPENGSETKAGAGENN